MLDRRFIVENVDAVRENCRQRGVQVDLDRLLELDSSRREKQIAVDDLNRQANEVSKSIGQAKDASEREARKEAGRRLRDETADAQVELAKIIDELESIQKSVPNMSHPDAPVGADDKANLELRRGKHAPREFGFKPLDHVTLAQKSDLIDFESAAKIAGHGFYFLKNEAVLLEIALQQYALSELVKEGFTPTITPDLAREEIVQGIGFIPRGPETQIYAIENSDLCLVATAEITLGGMHSKQVFDEEILPLKYCGVSHCFRTEAGAHGTESRGLFRVHQFTKIEMFAFTRPDQSDAMLGQLCEIECRLFDGLGIPYRVVDTATGDLGGPAYRKFDLEAWMPGRGENGEYGEVTSASNCTDYQARRLGIRYRKKGEKGTNFAHTLNGTAIACSRAIIAILENYQQPDGSVEVPEALRTWMGVELIKRT